MTDGSPTPDLAARNRGLQAERTTLAWSRTSLALTANGVLVLLRHEHDFPLGVSVGLGAIVALTAALAIGFSKIRRAAVLTRGAGIRAAPRPILALGSATVLLCASTSFALLTNTR